MAERPAPHGSLQADPLVRALIASIREIAARRAEEELERRRRMAVITGKEDQAA